MPLRQGRVNSELFLRMKQKVALARKMEREALLKGRENARRYNEYFM